jgi:hypothetical protein
VDRKQEMFKKPFKAQNRNKLKRSEVRRFRTGLLAAFNVTEEQLNQARLPCLTSFCHSGKRPAVTALHRPLDQQIHPTYVF